MGAKQWVTRKRHSTSFRYYHHDKLITNSSEKEYFASLAIPPAWNDVKIAVNKKSDLLVTGVDDAHRTQYMYSPAFRAKQEKAKFERILQFGQALPTLRKTVSQHINKPGYKKQKVVACIIALMDETYIRVGNKQYAKQNHSYGLTTLRSKHVSVTGDTITFDFMGKSNQQHIVHIKNRKISNLIRKLDDMPGYEIFRYYDQSGNLKDVTSHDVNEYIKKYMGEDFSAKDFRTWGGTLLAAAELGKCVWNTNKNQRAKQVTKCVKRVAKKLGNTPSIARKSYIDPRIIDIFLTKDTLRKIYKTINNTPAPQYLSSGERYLLDVLQSAGAA